MSGSKEKRLSILKSQKGGDPQSEDDNGGQRRRVSFASSNQIKKFVADEEANTIWFSSYEDTVSGSDNSGKSRAEAPISTDMNFTTPIGSSTILTNTVRLPSNESEDMEFTSCLNKSILCKDVNVESSSDSINDNKTKIYIDRDMEVTYCPNKTIICKEISVESSSDSINVDKTKIYTDRDMEVTYCPNKTILHTEVNIESPSDPISVNNFSSNKIKIYNDEEVVDKTIICIREDSAFTSNTNFDKENCKITDENKPMEIDEQRQGSFENTFLTVNETIDIDTRVDDETNFQTNTLINEDLLNAKKTNSELSRIVAGDMSVSFPRLGRMQLRGVNSTSFLYSGPSDPTVGGVESRSEADLVNTTSPCDLLSASITDTTVSTLSMPKEKPKGLMEMFAEANAEAEVLDVDRALLDLKREFDLEKKREEAIRRLNELIDKEANWNRDCEGYLDVIKSLRTTEIRKEIKEKSLLCKIQELGERDKKYWQLISTNDNMYQFSIFFKSVSLTVLVARDSEIINEFKIEKHYKDDWNIHAKYTNQILCNKLSPDLLKSALGSKYDIRSLLDFIKQTIQNLLDHMADWDQMLFDYGTVMKEDYRFRFQVTSFEFLSTWIFEINMWELDKISDKTVEITTKRGQNKNSLFRKIMADCPSGLAFVKTFVENVHKAIPHHRIA